MKLNFFNTLSSSSSSSSSSSADFSPSLSPSSPEDDLASESPLVGEVILLKGKPPIEAIHSVLEILLPLKEIKQEGQSASHKAFVKTSQAHKEKFEENLLIKCLRKMPEAEILETYLTYYAYQFLEKQSLAAMHTIQKELNQLTKEVLRDILFDFYEKNFKTSILPPRKKLSKTEFQKASAESASIEQILKSVFDIKYKQSSPVQFLLKCYKFYGVEEEGKPLSNLDRNIFYNFFYAEVSKTYDEAQFQQLLEIFENNAQYQTSIRPKSILMENCEKNLLIFQKNCKGHPRRSEKFKPLTVIGLFNEMKQLLVDEQKQKLDPQWESVRDFLTIKPKYQDLDINIAEKFLDSQHFQLLQLLLQAAKGNSPPSPRQFIKDLLAQEPLLFEVFSVLLPGTPRSHEKILASLKEVNQSGDEVTSLQRRDLDKEGKYAPINNPDWFGIACILVVKSCTAILPKEKLEQLRKLLNSEDAEQQSGKKPLVATKASAPVEEDKDMQSLLLLASAFVKEKRYPIFCKKLLASVNKSEALTLYQRALSDAVCIYLFQYLQFINYIGIYLNQLIDKDTVLAAVKYTPGYLGARYVREYLEGPLKPFYAYRLKIILATDPKYKALGPVQRKDLAEALLEKDFRTSWIEPFIVYQNKQGKFYACGYYKEKIQLVELSDIKIEQGISEEKVNQSLIQAILRKTDYKKINLIRASALSDTMESDSEFLICAKERLEQLREMRQCLRLQLLVLYEGWSKEYWGCSFDKNRNIVRVTLKEGEIFDMAAKQKTNAEIEKLDAELEEMEKKLMQTPMAVKSLKKPSSAVSATDGALAAHRQERQQQHFAQKSEIQAKMRGLLAKQFMFKEEELIITIGKKFGEKLGFIPSVDPDVDADYADILEVLENKDPETARAVRDVHSTLDCLTPEESTAIKQEFINSGPGKTQPTRAARWNWPLYTLIQGKVHKKEASIHSAATKAIPSSAEKWPHIWAFLRTASTDKTTTDGTKKSSSSSLDLV